MLSGAAGVHLEGTTSRLMVVICLAVYPATDLGCPSWLSSLPCLVVLLLCCAVLI